MVAAIAVASAGLGMLAGVAMASRAPSSSQGAAPWAPGPAALRWGGGGEEGWGIGNGAGVGAEREGKGNGNGKHAVRARGFAVVGTERHVSAHPPHTRWWWKGGWSDESLAAPVMRPAYGKGEREREVIVYAQ